MGIFTECGRCDELEDEIKLLQTEIERLRDHIKFLNSFRPDAELARLRGELASTAVENFSQAEEIERLRKLLREALEDGYIRVPYGASHEDVSAILDFEKRIRGAIRGAI